MTPDQSSRAAEIDRLAKELAIVIRSTAKPEDEKAADMVLAIAREASK